MTWKDCLRREALDVVAEEKSDSENGLSSVEARERLKKFGSNHLETKQISASKILIRQFISPFIYMLIAASALSFLLQQWLEGIMILIFLLINAGLGFFQEYRSEKTAKLLGELISWRTKTIRGGNLKTIDAGELVPGDIIILETGDKVSADARIIEAYSFSVDESSLTGESVSVIKHGERLVEETTNISEAVNIVFSGTTVTSGKARAVVIATGKSSVIGGIATLSAQTKKVSSFANNISGLSNFIVKLVLITLTFVFVINLAIKGGDANWMELVIFSIALAIGVIPEALPLVMTFSFSSGAMSLAKHKVIVKRLSSIEDLGNIEILCSDKTGTLTEGKLKLFDVYDRHASREEVLTSAILASGEQGQRLDPFDTSLKKAASRKMMESIKKIKILFSSPFDPKFLRNNALIEEEGKIDFIVRGAPEIILGLTKNTKDECFTAEQWVEQQGQLGRRVLGIAKKRFSTINLDNFRDNCRNEEKDLELTGLISFADNIKETAARAIRQAKAMDIKIKIITGDSREVAGAIARQIGLIADQAEVLPAADLDKMNQKEKEAAVLKYSVFSRVSPDSKHEIIKLLQEHSSVGYLGDGINDAPALKAAGVSLAVDNAADVAREAADFILTEGDLNVIIEGISEGRKIFINSAKYIKATLASNFGNFYAVAIASLLIPFLPMLPLQILLLNLLSDFPMIAIATDNVDEAELSSPKKYQTRDILVVAMILGIISTIFDFVFFAMFKNISPGVLQTNWFIASILTELGFLFSIRTKGFMLAGKKPSKLIMLLTSTAAALTIIIPYTAWGQAVFNFVPPQAKHLLWILAIAFAFLLCSEVVKIVYYRNKKLSEAS